MSKADEPSRSAGPLALLTMYLSARRPGALAADGLALLVISILFSHLWQALYSTLDPAIANRPSTSLLGAIARPTSLMGTLYSILWYAAWVLLGWAGVRALSDAIRSAGARSPDP